MEIEGMVFSGLGLWVLIEELLRVCTEIGMVLGTRVGACSQIVVGWPEVSLGSIREA